jgi:LysM repeat protein
VRKWTKSACVALAWSILVPLLAVTALFGPAAQANASTASNTGTTPASASGSTRPAPASQPAVTKTQTTPVTKTALTAARRAAVTPAATWTVRPGDTLSAIAAALAVPGGWPALYTANRHAIGPDPALIRPGTVLTIPGTTAPARPRGHAPSPAPAADPPPSARPAPAPSHPATAPSHPATAPANATVPAAGLTAPAGGMPRWLEDVLLTAGILGLSAFAAEPAAALARRRRTARSPAQHPPVTAPAPVPCAAPRARIILADHERLIVTYSTQDDTAYVLTPPGEDPRAVLRAARLVLPESTYQQLAGHLGVPAAWPRE